MLRAINTFGQKGLLKKAKLISQSSALFSATQNAETYKSSKTFEEKAAFFERFQNSFLDGDRLEERIKITKEVNAKGNVRSALEDKLVPELKRVYGKNFEKVLNQKFDYEIYGHKDGVVEGEYELFPQDLTIQGQLKTPTKNSELLNQLHATSYIEINEKEIHASVVQQNSHFSLILDDYVPDEYVSELQDNQVCVFGFPKSVDQADVKEILSSDPLAAAVQNIVIGECILSLPAYAVLSFPSQKEAQAYKKGFNEQAKVIDKRPLYATTFEDSRKEHSENRTLLVSGFQSTETINELINFLSFLGSVMHFEIVQEPVHSALPTSEQVLAYLKEFVKPGDESIIYELTDNSTDELLITEYPPYHPKPEFIRDPKKVSEIQEEIELEKKRNEDLAKRQLTPRIVLNTWDNHKHIQEQYKQRITSEEEKKVMKAIQDNIRKEYTNKEYLFVTFACYQQAQIAYRSLNKTGIYETTLKKSTEHYHCDKTHLASVFKDIKTVKGEMKLQFNDKNISEIQDDKILQQSHQQMREQLLQEANSGRFSADLSRLLEKEVIGKTQHGFEHELHLSSQKSGREFSAKVEKSDVQQIVTQLQDRQKDNAQKFESIRQSEDVLLNLYRAKVMNADFNQISHPYFPETGKESEEIVSNLKNQAANDFVQRQKEFLQEQAFKAKWIEEAKEIMEKKAGVILRKDGRDGRDGRDGKERPPKKGAKDAVDEPPEIKEKEEEPDKYYAPFSDYSLAKKNNKYQRYVSEMQRLYDGEYSESMKNKIFRDANGGSTDVDGNTFVTPELGEKIDRIVLTDEQYADIEYFNQIKDILPNKRINSLFQQGNEHPNETLYMLQQLELPTQVFDRTKLSELHETDSNTSNQEFASHLNKYVAGLGQKYEVQKDARGDEKIVLYEREPHPVPLKALNVDEVQLLRDCLATYGFDADSTEKEVQYFLKHGDYSAEVLKIVEEADNASQDTNKGDSEIDALIQATGLSKAELESLMNLDFEKDGANVILTLQKQKEELAFKVKMSAPKPQDLIKGNTHHKIKDKHGKYQNSIFKLF